MTMWHTLEHVPNPLGYVREINRILREGGVLALSVPQLKSAAIRLLGKRCGYLCEAHLFYFTPRSIRKLLQDTEYQVVVLKTGGFDKFMLYFGLFEWNRCPNLAEFDRSRERFERVWRRWYTLPMRVPARLASVVVTFLNMGDTLTVVARKGQR